MSTIYHLLTVHVTNESLLPPNPTDQSPWCNSEDMPLPGFPVLSWTSADGAPVIVELAMGGGWDASAS